MADDRAQGKELLLVTVSGPDRPGITAAMTAVMTRHNVEVLDIEQASLQDFLGLSFLIDVGGVSSSQDSVIKDLLFEASRLHLTLNFKLFSPDDVSAAENRNLYVLTYFGGTRVLAELSHILGEENINIEMISSMSHHCARCVEMVLNVGGAESLRRAKSRIMSQSRQLNADVALQKMEAYRKNKRLIFFDMDSTLIDMEVIDEMARRAGVLTEVARITEKAMRGDFDFEEALIQRVALLKGLKVEDLEEIRDNLRLSEGVSEVAATLKGLGYKLCVVSGGFDFFTDHLKEKLGFDFAFSNHLEIKKGVLTGRVTGTIVDAVEKARIVNRVAEAEGILPDQTVAVGDGANDALMLGQAGLGMAYNAKPRLDRAANVSLGYSRLMNILYLLGISEDDVRQVLERRSK